MAAATAVLLTRAAVAAATCATRLPARTTVLPTLPPVLLRPVNISIWQPVAAASTAAAAAAGRAAAAKGGALEARLAKLLAAGGAWNVRTNVRVRDGHGNLSEIDVRSGLLRHTYYECKAYGADHSVPLEDVAKFKEVLRLLGVSPSRGVFVTTSTYSPRATTIGIRTVDGTQLREWERRVARWRAARWLARAAVLATLLAGAVLAAAPLYAAAALPGYDTDVMDRLLMARRVAARHAAEALNAAQLAWDDAVRRIQQ